MRDIILNKLDEIEKAEGVRILHAVESGSRAWGFASPDSDFDVRFVYVRPRKDYLRLDRVRDVIEWQLDDTLDINGWDLKKLLTLLNKSNPTVFEWNCSPIVYKTCEDWKGVSEVIERHFNEKAALYHYLNTARTNFRIYCSEERVRYKKYFYVLRPLLACKWILGEKTPPPMPFGELCEKYLDEEIRGEVEELLRLKSETSELGEGKPNERLNAYFKRTIDETDSALSKMPSAFDGDWEELNALFLSFID